MGSRETGAGGGSPSTSCCPPKEDTCPSRGQKGPLETPRPAPVRPSAVLSYTRAHKNLKSQMYALFGSDRGFVLSCVKPALVPARPRGSFPKAGRFFPRPPPAVATKPASSRTGGAPRILRAANFAHAQSSLHDKQLAHSRPSRVRSQLPSPAHLGTARVRPRRAPARKPRRGGESGRA